MRLYHALFQPNPLRSVPGRRWLALAALLLAGHTAFAGMARDVNLKSPGTAAAGSNVSITLAATTERDGEQIGFFHSEYSIDNGKTWVALSYDADAGPAFRRRSTFKVGPVGTVTLVRLRVCFRSKAGDVDFNGDPINWNGSWEKWLKPPAKYSTINVGA